MAHPNIELLGATYPTVPSVLLPVSGGGSAEFFDMSDDMSFLGKDVELLDSNLYSYSYALKDTAFNGWTASTTAKTCITSVTVSNKFTAENLVDYEYYLCWEVGQDVSYDGTEVQKALTLYTRGFLIQEIFRRPSSTANITASSFNGNVCNSAFTQNFMRYYGTTEGTQTYTWSSSYGFYFTLVASTFSSTTADSPKINLKTPTMSARCSTTYLSTANAAKVDQTKSTGFIKCKLYRCRRAGFLRGATQQVVRMLNEM